MMGRSHLVAQGSLAGGTLVLLHGASSMEQVVPASVAEHPSGVLVERAVGWEQVTATLASWSQWTWDQLFPHGLVWWWLVPAVVLFWLGSLLPDVDNSRSMLGRWVKVSFGPHRGITHSDWVLWVLFLVSIPPVTRILVFLWAGAWLHGELDGWSRAGRVRFWPLTAHKVVNVGHPPQPCVVRTRSRRFSYRTGGPSELVAVGLCVAVGAGLGALGWSL